jgi:hypothetical protein
MPRLVFLILSVVFDANAMAGVVLYPGGFYWAGPVQISCRANL